jgi:hypothetical protein
VIFFHSLIHCFFTTSILFSAFFGIRSCSTTVLRLSLVTVQSSPVLAFIPGVYWGEPSELDVKGEDLSNILGSCCLHLLSGILPNEFSFTLGHDSNSVMVSFQTLESEACNDEGLSDYRYEGE